MANSVDTVGYLIYGVFWKSGNERAQPTGKFNGGIEESHLQQIVNRKLNRPVNFSYDELTYQSQTVGILSVPYSDTKPHQVKTEFPRPTTIREGQVFIRRGTSTAIATVEEIIEMSLNAFNDLAKIEEDDLSARLVVMLRRGDHVGIREMLRNAQRSISHLLATIESKNHEEAKPVVVTIKRYLDRIMLLGFAIVRHRCIDCYDDLLRCLSHIYLATEIAVLRPYHISHEAGKRVFVIAGLAMAVRNYDFIMTLLRHRAWTQSQTREYLFLNFLGGFESLLNSLGNISDLLVYFDCDAAQLNAHLCEYDFLADFWATVKRRGDYKSKWKEQTYFAGNALRDFIEDVSLNSELCEFLTIKLGAEGESELSRFADVSKPTQ